MPTPAAVEPPPRTAYIGARMEIRGIRLHRHPAIDLSALAAALVAAFLFLRLTGVRAPTVPVPSVPIRFDPDSALLDTRILAEAFTNRITGTEAGRGAASYLAASFQTRGLRVTRQRFPLTAQGQPALGRNVIGVSRGTVPGTIVLVAHYDGQPTSGQSAAADASGVGTLLELARVLERHGHRHTIAYVATDANEWGVVGAATYAQSRSPADRPLAVISLDHVDNGIGKVVTITGAGRAGDGYAPLWLRRAAADAYAVGGVRTTDIGTLDEWIHRVLGLSRTDQGPFVDLGMPAIDLGVEGRRPEYASFLYHTPGDRWETLEPVSFGLLGDGAERLVLALDAAARDPSGPTDYLGLGGDRMVGGLWILLAAIALFVPLLLACWEAWTAAWADPASRAAVRSELVRAGSWWVIALTGLLAVRAAVAIGLLPDYGVAPPPVRDPFLYATRWIPFLATLAIMVIVALLLGAMRRRPGLTASHPLAGRAASLTMLVVIVILTLPHNPFAAVWLLLLPAWLWPWIGPTRRPVTGAASVLIVLASAVPLVVAIAVMSRPLDVGAGILWYLYLQAAYLSWSPFTILAFVVMLLAASRLVGTATARLLPAAGD